MSSAQQNIVLYLRIASLCRWVGALGSRAHVARTGADTTTRANERAQSDNKKTIQPQHVFEALKELEFEAFLPRCQDELSSASHSTCSCPRAVR